MRTAAWSTSAAASRATPTCSRHRGSGSRSVSALLECLGVELPVVQAGMGGGLAGHELATAVSEAGGLGTIGTLPPRALARELSKARARTGRPIAVNLIQPLVGRRHWQAAASADVIVTHWG